MYDTPLKDAVEAQTRVLEGIEETLKMINSNIVSMGMVSDKAAMALERITELFAEDGVEIVEFKSKDGEYGQR